VIRGAVDASHEAVIELTIGGSDPRSVRLPFVVDTGFSGGITLPSEIVADLELRPRGSGRAWLGDGSLAQFAIFEAFVDWEGTSRRVRVEVAETTPLLGMELLKGHQLRIDVLPGGTVSITNISDPLAPSV
jgi:clan AA aspartic protease